MTDKELQDMMQPQLLREFLANPQSQDCIKNELLREFPYMGIDEDEQIAGKIGSAGWCPIAMYLRCSTLGDVQVDVGLGGIAHYESGMHSQGARIDTPGWATGFINYVDSAYSARRLCPLDRAISYLDRIEEKD